jgi:hypothetical protein
MGILADFHVHGSDSHRLEWSNGKPYSPRDTSSRLLNRSLSESGRTKKTTLVAIVSFEDDRANRTLEEIKMICFRGLYTFTDHEHMVSVTDYGRNGF